MIHKHNR